MPRKKAAKIKCEKCGKEFGIAMHLGRHMTTIHGQSPKVAMPKKAAKRAARKRGRVGRPPGVVGRLGLRALSLDQLVDVIQAAKQEAVGRLLEIADVLLPATPKRPGRPPRKQVVATRKAAPTRKHRTRRKFKASGTKSILAFVKNAGKKGATTAEIVKKWKKEGRSGDGYTTLGALVKAKKLKKEKIEGAKGSRYTAA